MKYNQLLDLMENYGLKVDRHRKYTKRNKERAERQLMLEFRKRREWGYSIEAPDTKRVIVDIIRFWDDNLRVYRAISGRFDIQAYSLNTVISMMRKKIRNSGVRGTLVLDIVRHFKISKAERFARACAIALSPSAIARARSDQRLNTIDRALRGEGPWPADVNQRVGEWGRPHWMYE